MKECQIRRSLDYDLSKTYWFFCIMCIAKWMLWERMDGSFCSFYFKCSHKITFICTSWQRKVTSVDRQTNRRTWLYRLCLSSWEKIYTVYGVCHASCVMCKTLQDNICKICYWRIERVYDICSMSAFPVLLVCCCC